jgi:hypothetical protein
MAGAQTDQIGAAMIVAAANRVAPVNRLSGHRRGDQIGSTPKPLFVRRNHRRKDDSAANGNRVHKRIARKFPSENPWAF